MLRHGRKMSPAECKLMISMFDENNDCLIDYEEFLLVITRRILREAAQEVWDIASRMFVQSVHLYIIALQHIFAYENKILKIGFYVGKSI